MDIIRVFGQNVRKYRTAKGLSQEAFAERCGLHRTYISTIERFQRNVSLENVQRIADALEIESYRLLMGDEITGETDSNGKGVTDELGARSRGRFE